jgi:hypothetical protein
MANGVGALCLNVITQCMIVMTVDDYPLYVHCPLYFLSGRHGSCTGYSEVSISDKSSFSHVFNCILIFLISIPVPFNLIKIINLIFRIWPRMKHTGPSPPGFATGRGRALATTLSPTPSVHSSARPRALANPLTRGSLPGILRSFHSPEKGASGRWCPSSVPVPPPLHCIPHHGMLESDPQPDHFSRHYYADDDRSQNRGSTRPYVQWSKYNPPRQLDYDQDFCRVNVPPGYMLRRMEGGFYAFALMDLNDPDPTQRPTPIPPKHAVVPPPPVPSVEERPSAFANSWPFTGTAADRDLT